MHPFGYLLVFCLPATYSAAQVEFNTTKSIYTVGDIVKLTCFINTNWMSVSFYRNHNILIGDCLTFYNGCRATNYTLTRHKRYTLSLDNSNPVLYINNVTKEDSDVTFTCLWTSFRDTVSFHVQDPLPTSPPSRVDGETKDYFVLYVPVIGGVIIAILTGIILLIYKYTSHRRENALKQGGHGLANKSYVYQQANSPHNNDTNISIDGLPETPNDGVRDRPYDDLTECRDNGVTESTFDGVQNK